MPQDTPPTPTDPDAPIPAMLSAPPGSALTDSAPTEAWYGLHRRLYRLLQSDHAGQEFESRLEQIVLGLERLVLHHEDESLFVLVQMLLERRLGYSASHALLCAAMCRMIAPLAGLADHELPALIRAALTMNSGMSRLQDRLSQQIGAIDEFQRQEIAQHPQRSVEFLQSKGVSDRIWLEWVQDHHEEQDGTGYPTGKRDLPLGQRILHMSDIFVARISPRLNRRGLSPNLAVGNLYLESQGQGDPLGAIFVKQLGMYPPGTFVRLKNDETAVVVRRGERVNTPLAMAIADADGMPLSTPSQRDTKRPLYAVKQTIAPEDIKIRLDAARLLKRL